MATTDRDVSSLLTSLITTLKGEVEKGDKCPSATLNVARQLIKDLGVSLDPDILPKAVSDLRDGVASLDETLPDFDSLPN